MITIYLDRNVDVKSLKKAIDYSITEGQIDLLQWPLEGRTKRIRDYGLPAGQITWNDLVYTKWNELDYCLWNDFSSTDV